MMNFAETTKYVNENREKWEGAAKILADEIGVEPPKFAFGRLLQSQKQGINHGWGMYNEETNTISVETGFGWADPSFLETCIRGCLIVWKEKKTLDVEKVDR